MILAQFVSVVLAQRTRKEMMSATDVRVKLMNEILTGIRIIKYYCWEKPFKGKIDGLRQNEIQLNQKMSWIMSIGMNCLTSLIPSIVPMVCFILYPKFNNGTPLKAATAYSMLTVFRLMQRPITTIPMIFLLLVQFNVSIKRIRDFLNLEEVDPSNVIRDYKQGQTIQYKTVEGQEKTIQND